MKYLGILAGITALTVISAVFAGSPAQAAPSGSYTNSCTNIVDDGAGSPTVSASCKKKDGSYKNTSLAYKICESEIWNDNGNLKCNPKGSFKNSCRNISWNADFLMAECSKGGWPKKYLWNSGFNYHACLNNNKDITNCRGSLQCGGC